jgi:hypothetical protein
MEQDRKIIDFILLNVRRELFKECGLRLWRQDSRLFVYVVIAEPVTVGTFEIAACGKLQKNVTKD